MGEGKKAVVYGTLMGNFDVKNISTYLDRNKLDYCVVFLEKLPVDSVLASIGKDSRVEIKAAKKPKAEAKKKAQEFKDNSSLFALERLEKVSDRSSFRGGC